MRSLVGGVLIALFCAGTAAADIALDPEEQLYSAGQTIQREGIACGNVTALAQYGGAEAERLRLQGYARMEVATCSNGARVLMAYGPRYRRGLQRPGPQVPPIIRVITGRPAR